MIITQKSLRIWSSLKVLWVRRCSRNEAKRAANMIVNELHVNERLIRLIRLKLRRCCSHLAANISGVSFFCLQ